MLDFIFQTYKYAATIKRDCELTLAKVDSHIDYPAPGTPEVNIK